MAMNSLKKLVLMTLILNLGSFSFGQKSDQSSEEALREVVKLLTSPNARQKVIVQDKKAQEADDFLQQVGGAFSEDMYQLAGTIFQSLFSQTGGNADKMDEILSKAKKDPASFINSLPPDQIKALRDLASKIDKSKNRKESDHKLQ